MGGPFAATGNGAGQYTYQIGRATRLNSSHLVISYAVFCLKKKSGASNSICRACASPSLVACDLFANAVRVGSNSFARSFSASPLWSCYFFANFFFFNDTATTQIYSFSLHAPLPI